MKYEKWNEVINGAKGKNVNVNCHGNLLRLLKSVIYNGIYKCHCHFTLQASNNTKMSASVEIFVVDDCTICEKPINDFICGCLKCGKVYCLTCASDHNKRGRKCVGCIYYTADSALFRRANAISTLSNPLWAPPNLTRQLINKAGKNAQGINKAMESTLSGTSFLSISAVAEANVALNRQPSQTTWSPKIRLINGK